MNVRKLFFLSIVSLLVFTFIGCSTGKDFTANKIEYRENTISDTDKIGIMCVSTEEPHIVQASLSGPFLNETESFSRQVNDIDIRSHFKT